MIDLAIPIKGRRDVPDTLQYVLRTVYHHFEVDRIFLIGGTLPGWVTNVEFIKVPPPGSKHQNIGANLEAVLETDISEDFIWSNDDIFWTKDCPEVLLHHRDLIHEGEPETYCEWTERHREDALGGNDHLAFIQGMIAQHDFAEARGWDCTKTTDGHFPMPVNKTRMKSIINELPPEMTGHFRGVYGADLPSTPLTDPKIKDQIGHHPDDWPYVSTNSSTWHNGAVGRWIRDRFWRPSPYEKT